MAGTDHPRRPPPHSALDGPAGRIGAALVLALVVAALLAIHWDDLFPPETAAAGGDDPLAACIAERGAEIEAMIEQNPAMAGRREMLLASVPAMCADQLGEGGSGGPPAPPPGLPAQ